MSAIRILLADDHTLVRAGIRSLLESIEGVEVVAESGDGRDALELICKHRPDVALLDIAMPGLSGLEVAKRVAQECPKTRIVILSMHADASHVREALRSGVAGYLLKGAAVAELPDGEVSFEDWIDDDGIDVGQPIRLFCTMKKQGDRMTVDWTSAICVDSH